MQNMEQDNLEAVDSNNEKQVISSILASLITNITENNDLLSNNHATQNMEQDNLEAVDSNNEKQIISSILASLITNITENNDLLSNNHATQSMDREIYPEENCLGNDSIVNDAVMENIENEIIVPNKNSAEHFNEMSPTKNTKRKKHLINQSLSLPYFKLSRPDFHEFTNSVAKNLEVPMKGPQPLLFKHKDKFSRLEQSQYNKCSFGKEFVVDKKYDDIVLCEGSSGLKSAKRPCSKPIKESYKFRREDLFRQLKDQMQKKKEAAFDRHKEIQQADDELCGSDFEEFDYDSSSPSPSITNEDSCTQGEKEFSESAVESISIGDQDTFHSSDPSEDKFDDYENFMDSPTVSLSIPSFQPNGGFADQSDISSDSCSLDEEKGPFESKRTDEEKLVSFEIKNLDKDLSSFETISSPHSLPLENSFDLDTSQVPIFELDEVSTICSGRFLSMDEERPWTPSSDSQINKKKDLDVGCDDEESRCSVEELNPEKNNYDAEKPPPLKKCRKDFIHETSGKFSSSLKMDEIMQDVYDNSSVSEDAGQTFNHTGKEPIILNSKQESYETDDDEDNDEKQIFPRARKCRPIIEDSDDDEETCLSYNHHNELNEDSPQNQDNDIPKPLKMNDFFDEEAQLSGDEMSSDESEGDEGDDEVEEELAAEDIPAEEELKEQVANIYFKHEQDDDARIVKRLQQDFLPEGELYVDGSGRQKSFHWNNNATNDIQNEVLSESEPEDNIDYPMQQDKIKWRQETSVIQKVSDNNSSDDEDDKVQTLNLKKLPVSIIGRVLSNQTVIGVNKQVKSSPITRRHGSLIHVAGSEGLNLNVPSSVQRKTVLFQTLAQSDKVNSGSSQVLNGKSIFEKLL